MNFFTEKQWHLLRYLLSGGTAAAVLLLVLHVLVAWFGMYYLVASALAFSVSFCVSFLLQKFFTFRDHETERMHTQAALYLVVFLCNIAINTALMYTFVDIVGISYLISQVLTGGIIAMGSYFIYKHLIFAPLV